MGEIGKSIGPIKNVRLVLDKETNKSRGFAFIEYYSIQDAQRAIQSFHGVPINGRVLRADFANEGSAGRRRQPMNQMNNQGPMGQMGQMGQMNPMNPMNPMNQMNQMNPMNQMPPMMPGFPPPPMPQPPSPQNFQTPSVPPSAPPQPSDGVPANLVADDNISRTLSQIPPPQLLQIMTSIRSLISQDQSKASELLHSNMNMTYALVQALLLMGLVDKTVVTQAVQAQMQNTDDQDTIPSRPVPSATSPSPAPNTNNSSQSPGPDQPPPGMDPNQWAMIQQVLALTEDQINSLAPNERQAIMALRAQYAH